MTGPVVFDGSILGAGPWTGVASSFVTTLDAWLDTTSLEAIVVLPDEASRDALHPLVSDRAELRVEPSLSGLLRPIARTRLWQRLGPAIWHSPVAALPAGPLDRGAGFVATIHDLPWMRGQELDGERPFGRHRRALRRALRAARAGRGRILVPSANTATELRASEGNHEVTVCAPGLANPEAPPDLDRSRRTGPFVVLGDDRPRKNIDRLKRAHAAARARCPTLPELLIAGPIHGFLNEEEKDRRVRAATALLHLSLHEGFGMPIVEAFARGTPVLCSRIQVLDEVSAGAALQADPTDESEITEALLQLHQNAELRDRLARAGLDRARAFEPERSAAIWCDVHRNLAASHGGIPPG
ncbi:MAG: glycosyltransferase [Planctomycetota bacterium]